MLKEQRMNGWVYIATSFYTLQVSIVVENIILRVRHCKAGGRGLELTGAHIFLKKFEEKRRRIYTLLEKGSRDFININVSEQISLFLKHVKELVENMILRGGQIWCFAKCLSSLAVSLLSCKGGIPFPILTKMAVQMRRVYLCLSVNRQTSYRNKQMKYIDIDIFCL